MDNFFLQSFNKKVEKTSEGMHPIEKKANRVYLKIEHIQNEMDELKMLKKQSEMIF